MNETVLTLENLPKAVNQLAYDVSEIKRLLLEKSNTTQPAAEPELLTIDEAAKFLNLSKPTLYSKASRGELPYMKRGRLYFSRLELMKYIKEGRQQTNAEIQENAAQYLVKRKGGKHE